MKTGWEEFYINGNKFSVCVREVGYQTKYLTVEVCQQRYLSGNAFDETGNHGKSWFRNISAVNRQKAINMYQLLKQETI
jgi:hypothetical protein